MFDVSETDRVKPLSDTVIKWRSVSLYSKHQMGNKKVVHAILLSLLPSHIPDKDLRHMNEKLEMQPVKNG
jgi:hypothetical protein